MVYVFRVGLLYVCKLLGSTNTRGFALRSVHACCKCREVVSSVNQLYFLSSVSSADDESSLKAYMTSHKPPMVTLCLHRLVVRYRSSDCRSLSHVSTPNGRLCRRVPRRDRASYKPRPLNCASCSHMAHHGPPPREYSLLYAILSFNSTD